MRICDWSSDVCSSDLSLPVKYIFLRHAIDDESRRSGQIISLHCIAADVGQPVERSLFGEALLLLRRGHAPHLEEIVKLGEIEDFGKLPVLRQRLQPLLFRTAPLDVAEPPFLRLDKG